MELLLLGAFLLTLSGLQSLYYVEGATGGVSNRSCLYWPAGAPA